MKTRSTSTSGSLRIAAVALCISLAACSNSSSSSSSSPASTIPDFGSATFTNPTRIDNPLFPLEIGLARAFLATAEDTYETLIVERLDEVRVVDGVDCAVVRDRVWEEEVLIEDTRDFYAQDDDGNVWYMGEEVDNYNYDDDGNLIDITHEGAWEAGLDVLGIGSVAQPGYVMKAAPMVGDTYNQEFYDGEAEDMGKVIALNVPVTLPDGTMYSCLQTEDYTPLEPGSREYKFYAPGLGVILEQKIGSTEAVAWVGSMRPGETSIPDITSASFSNPTAVDHPLVPYPTETSDLLFNETADESEVIIVERKGETRLVMGIECIVIRDRVFADGLLIEDTDDWYAQDDDGNLWYMGETVVNFEYDDDGNLISMDSGGSWEAGQDINGVGSVALPGYQMAADPVPGSFYHQEFYEGEAEDMAQVVATDLEVELSDGTSYSDCLQTLEWTPLEPSTLEYKYYAPGLGLVLETKLGPEEALELRGRLDRSARSLPDVALATFSNPSVITQPDLQYVVGSTKTYTAETEDGTETIIVDALAMTRMVMGIECAVIQDRVFLDGVIIEDTFDWYAQDDDGNVWYMGEEVDNYNYDKDGNLTGIDHEGSWEAGLDINGSGSIAEPGHHVPASLTPGDSYYQEFYEDEAEDMAMVVRLDATVELSTGTTYEDCLQTLEWNPLDAGAIEYKFYAKGVGLVMEIELGSDEPVELTDSSL